MELRRMMLDRHARYVPVMEGSTLLGVISFQTWPRRSTRSRASKNRMLKSYISDDRT